MRQSLPRTRHFSFNIFYFLSVLFLLALGVYVFFLWQNGKFGKSERFNLILAAKPVTLISLDTKMGTATVVTFPDDLFVSEVVPNYGGYRISAVYKVGELDKRGGKVLSWTVSELLGVPVDGFSADNFQNPGFFLNGKSDLNLLDRLRFVMGFSQIRFDKIDQIDMRKYAEPLVLADGSTALGVDKTQLDSVLAGEFVESEIRGEGLRVEVINPTTVAALGARAGRVLAGLGMIVVNVGSSGSSINGCRVQSEKKNIASQTVKRIAQIYSCQVMERETQSRADVTVTLGKDYAQRFSSQ